MVFGLVSNEALQRTVAPKRSAWGGQGQDPSNGSAKLLACLVNVGRGKIHTLSEEETVIGRGSVCEILINADPTVSRRHAIITMIGGEFYLQDLGSRNGTLVNGEAVNGTRIKLSPEDKINIGKTEYVFSPIGISEALYGSQLKEIGLKSRLSLSSNAVRQLVTTLASSVRSKTRGVSRVLGPKASMQVDTVPINK
jgi:pSer/pThr/pTyr-binding forkhead associated (FHA) protein